MATHNENNSGSTEVTSIEVPVEVQVNTENGVDPQALTLATAFMERVGGLARLTKRRGDLSHLYIYNGFLDKSRSISGCLTTETF